MIGLLLSALAWSPAGAGERIDLWENAQGPQLRGANLHQRRVFPDLDGADFLGAGPFGPPVEQADLDRLAQAGANLVVLSHSGIFGDLPPYRLDQAALANLDRLVGMAAAADLFVVIALRSGPGRSDFAILPDGAGEWYDPSYLNTAIWGDLEAQQAWSAMWRVVAKHFRGHRAVVGYELMVEPNSNHIGADAADGAPELWDPAAFEAAHAGSSYDWNRLYPQILAAVREVDPDMPVLIGGNGYSGAEWLPHVAVGPDPRVVYVAHIYGPFDYTHQEPGARIAYPGSIDLDWDGREDPFAADALETMLAPVDEFLVRQGPPVAVTEFGAVRWAPGVAHFLADRIAGFERRGINWAIWGWPVAWPPMGAGDNAFSLSFGADPSATGPAATGPSAEAPGLAILLESWSRNVLRPSDRPF
ncbi:MAG: glycoside hydrolase family 5 protein [Alphaproteobacteria bacterium]